MLNVKCCVGIVLALGAGLSAQPGPPKEDAPISLEVLPVAQTICAGGTATLDLWASDYDYVYDSWCWDDLTFSEWPGPEPVKQGEVYHAQWKPVVEEPGEYGVTAKADDVGCKVNNNEVSAIARIYAIGGPIIQVSPPSGEPVVHWTCSQHSVDSAQFKATDGQPVGTIYHWTFTNSAIARFRVGDLLYQALSGNYPNVTVVPADGTGAGTCQTAVKLEYELNQKRCAAPNQIAVKSQTSATIRLIGLGNIVPLNPGWTRDAYMQVVDQCNNAYSKSVWVNEYRFWCKKDDPYFNPPTWGGYTADNGQFTDVMALYVSWPSHWCAKANNQWAAGGCNNSAGWFCHQWYATYGTTKEGTCQDCATCTPE